MGCMFSRDDHIPKDFVPSGPSRRGTWDDSRLHRKDGTPAEPRWMRDAGIELHWMANADHTLRRGAHHGKWMGPQPKNQRKGMVRKRKGQKHADGTRHLIDCKCLKKNGRDPDDQTEVLRPTRGDNVHEPRRRDFANRGQPPPDRGPRSRNPSPVPSEHSNASTSNLTALAREEVMRGMERERRRRGPPIPDDRDDRRGPGSRGTRSHHSSTAGSVSGHGSNTSHGRTSRSGASVQGDHGPRRRYREPREGFRNV